jgi:hypothetical protein
MIYIILVTIALAAIWLALDEYNERLEKQDTIARRLRDSMKY